MPEESEIRFGDVDIRFYFNVGSACNVQSLSSTWWHVYS